MARVNAGRLDGKGMGMGPKGGQRFEVWSCRLTASPRDMHRPVDR